MPTQALTLVIILVFFGIICVAELYRPIRQMLRQRRDEAASSPHKGEESTWNELTEHHRPVRSTEPGAFSCGPHERLAAVFAPYALCHHEPWDRLACSDTESKREMLARDWGVHSRLDLLTQIFWLIMSGHRNGFDEERARWTNVSLAQAERYELANFEVSPRIAYNHAVRGRQYSYYNSQTIEQKQSGGRGIEIEVPVSKKFANQSKISIVPFYRGWKVKKSETVIINLPQGTYGATEPLNYTHEAGVKVQYSF